MCCWKFRLFNILSKTCIAEMQVWVQETNGIASLLVSPLKGKRSFTENRSSWSCEKNKKDKSGCKVNQCKVKERIVKQPINVFLLFLFSFI